MGQVCSTIEPEDSIFAKKLETDANMKAGEQDYQMVSSKAELVNDTATTTFKEGEKSEILSEVVSEEYEDSEGVLVTVNRWGQVVKARPAGGRPRVKTIECIE